jgi:hypothetical protein
LRVRGNTEKEQKSQTDHGAEYIIGRAQAVLRFFVGVGSM